MNKYECPVCNSTKNRKIIVRTQEREKKEIKTFICEECTAVYFEDYKKDRSYIYEDENYSPWGREGETNEDIVALSKKETFNAYLFLLKRYIEPKGKKLLDVGTGKGYFLEIAKELGFEIYGVEPSRYCSKIAQKSWGKISCVERLKIQNMEMKNLMWSL